METFFTFLEKRVDDCSSLLCVGLDPHVSDLKSPSPASALDFCLNLVKQTAPYAAAFKPNAAFFEVFGAEGWTALKQVIAAIDEESKRLGSLIPVILDAKRGDIASTAEAYAKSAFESLGAHCITLSPYLGKDSIEPFLSYPEKGVFLLCKTSNAGSMDLQNLLVLPMVADNPMPLYNYVANWHNSGTRITTSVSSSARLTRRSCPISAPPRLICGSCPQVSARKAGNSNSR
jgi:orotidine 5'-phosphate decarboxylase subfamily 2